MRTDVSITKWPRRGRETRHGIGQIPRLVDGATRIGALAALATLAVSSSLFARDDVRTEISIDIPDPAYERPTWNEERATFGFRLAEGYGLDDALAEEFAGWILEASTRQTSSPNCWPASS